jgi:hypothetical protein
VLVALPGSVHPLANAVNDVGPVDDALPLEHLQLVLKRSPEREAALDALIDQLHDPKSPSFHQWLTPQEFADSFGVPSDDVAAVSGWMQSHGLRVDRVAPSRMFIEFSGSAGTVSKTFRTSIHRLNVQGALHFSNMSDPLIPAALTDVVVGVHALHDFMPQPQHIDIGKVKRDGKSGRWEFDGSQPSFTVSGGTYYAVAPPDFATIYNLNPLFSANNTGAGQTIAVIENTNILHPSDVSSFRQSFGLPPGTFSQIHPGGCTDPGVNRNEGEAALDAEWAGAAAPGANIVLASCADSAVFGGLTAIQNLVNSCNPPPIISLSYGECETGLQPAGNASFAQAYKQAAAEGISVFVSSGDEGAASCDTNNPMPPYSQLGISVNGMASTPYNVAVGGTDFIDTYESHNGGPALSTYWQASNSMSFGSAKSYIPETPWNSSCASQLISKYNGFTVPYGPSGFCSSLPNGNGLLNIISGSGGPSNTYSQPSWQTGVPGLPTASGEFTVNGQAPRALPDISLFAANGAWGHFYVYCMTDTNPGQGGVSSCNFSNTNYVLAAGGTSFSAPALAGIQALVNQKTGSRQGNPNSVYYSMAASSLGDSGTCNSDRGEPDASTLPPPACVFNDVTVGDMAVPCRGSAWTMGTLTGDCYGYSSHGGTNYGALSPTPSGSPYAPGFGATPGWDYATGLGSINAYALVTNWTGPESDAGADAESEASVCPSADAGDAEAGSDAEAGADSGADADAGAGADTGADATIDSGADAGADTGADATTDTGADATADTGADAGADTGSDTGADAGADTGSDTGADAGADTGADAGADSEPDATEDASNDATTGPGPCTGVTLGASPSSPQNVNTPVTLMATPTWCMQPQYEFWVLPPGATSWSVAQSWSSMSTYAWNTTGLAGGQYAFEVWVKDATSNAQWDAYQSLYYTLLTPPCTNATLSPSVASPQNVGTPVTLSAGYSTCFTPQYEFWELAPGATSWSIVQSWSSKSTYNWTTTGLAEGQYAFEVWVKDASSTAQYDTYGSLYYTLSSPACTGATLSPSVASPQTVGTPVTLTGGRSACIYPQYEFWELAPGANSWSIVQPWSSQSTYAWTTTGLAGGQYAFEVWVRDASSNAQYDTWTSLYYTLATPPCTDATLSPSVASPQPVGTMVTLTGGQSTCIYPEYEFWVLPPGASSWSIAQPWGKSATYAWNTTGIATGQYAFQVWVKDTSSTAAYDTYLGMYYTLTP